MKSLKLYHAFFAAYGGGHFLAGVALWLRPSILGAIVRPTPDRGAAVVIAFFNVMTGCGFLAALGAETPRGRRACLGAALAADVANALGHLDNVLSRREPVAVGAPALVVMVAIVPLLGWMWSREPR